MGCNRGTDFVCTKYERCNQAKDCKNVPKTIRNKLNGVHLDRKMQPTSYARIKKRS